MKSLSTNKGRMRQPLSDSQSEKTTSIPKTKKRHISHFMIVIGFLFSFAGGSYIAISSLKTKQSNNQPAVLSATDQQKPVSPTSIPSPSPTEVVNSKIDIPNEDVKLVASETQNSSTSENEELEEEALLEDLPVSSPTATPTTPVISKVVPLPSMTGQKRVIVTPSINSYANIRSLPDRNSSLVTKVVSGQELIALGEKFNDLGEKWVNVSINNLSGWILGEIVQYVQASYTIPSTTTVAPTATIKINVPDRDTIYLYSRPSFNSSVNHKLTQSQTADVLVETKRWVKVVLSRTNVEGWISQDFISKTP